MEKPLRLFCCYAREDQPYLLQIKKHLKPYERDGLIVVQTDIDITPGEEWEQKITHFLNTSQVILLLVSPDFMASDYCYSKEMRRAMERHSVGEACVIPIILRPVYWQGAPFRGLQALPKDAKPVAGPDWNSLDEAFFDVAEGIRKMIEKLATQSTDAFPSMTLDSSSLESTKAMVVLTPEEIALVHNLVNTPKMAYLPYGGITTTSVLALAIITESLKNLTAGVPLIALRNGLNKGTPAVVDAIRSMSKPITTPEKVVQVATVSTGDADVGKLIADVIGRIGVGAPILLEEGFKTTTEVEYVEGIQFDKGYISPDFVTDIEKGEASIVHPYILIIDQKISTVADILPVLEKVVQTGSKELVIIATDIDGEALATLVVNKTRGVLNVLGVKAPGFGDRREQMLQDIAILTGGTVISKDVGLASVTLAGLGRARLVISNSLDTTIVEGKGLITAIQARVRQIKAQINETPSDYDREKYQERLAKLAGGVAIIKIGARTVAARKEEKKRFEIALANVQAAFEEGVVPGGGAVLLAAISSLDKVRVASNDEQVGLNILRHALEAPMLHIARQAGYNGASIVAGMLKRSHPYGFDIVKGVYVNMFEAGIVDPTKVKRIALCDAVAIADRFLTTKMLDK